MVEMHKDCKCGHPWREHKEGKKGSMGGSCNHKDRDMLGGKPTPCNCARYEEGLF